MFVAMAEDLRVIFIKLSDRLHNMKTLKYHPKKEKRHRIAMETLNVYAPIADRLGLFRLKNALEEECFKIIASNDYKKLRRELREIEKQREEFIKHAGAVVGSVLTQEGISGFQIDYRVKSIYSIHKKLVKKGLDNAQSLYDLFGIRIMVEDMADCYKVL